MKITAIAVNADVAHAVEAWAEKKLDLWADRIGHDVSLGDDIIGEDSPFGDVLDIHVKNSILEIRAVTTRGNELMLRIYNRSSVVLKYTGTRHALHDPGNRAGEVFCGIFEKEDFDHHHPVVVEVRRQVPELCLLRHFLAHEYVSQRPDQPFWEWDLEPHPPYTGKDYARSRAEGIV